MPWDQTVIYELHVRGFTKLHPEVQEQARGSYAGLKSAAAIKHLRELGITSIELLPIHKTFTGQRLAEKGLRDYWGYNTISFFAPAPEYAQNPLDSLREFKEMIAALHSEVEDLGGSDAVRTIVITGAGSAFSSGHDLKEMSAHRNDPDRGRAFFAKTMSACSDMMMSMLPIW